MKTQFTPQGIMPSGHTPGPWVSYPSPKGHAIDIHDGRDDTPFELIAHVPLTEKTKSGIRFTDERLANARLIAAAPELLEALNSLSESVSAMVGMSDDEPSPFLSRAGFAAYEANKQALAAITKATSQP